jgi:hypothetical protein
MERGNRDGERNGYCAGYPGGSFELLTPLEAGARGTGAIDPAKVGSGQIDRNERVHERVRAPLLEDAETSADVLRAGSRLCSQWFGLVVPRPRVVWMPLACVPNRPVV